MSSRSQAIRARYVIDATGDGDIFTLAGEAHGLDDLLHIGAGRLSRHAVAVRRGQQHVRVVLTEIGPSQVNDMLEHSTRLTQITGIGEGLRTLPGGEERGRLRHAGHAARNTARTPVRAGAMSVMSGPGVRCGAGEGACIFLSCAARRAADCGCKPQVGPVMLCSPCPGGGMADALA